MPIFQQPIPSEYGYATSFAPSPTRPEPTRPAPVRLSRADVIKQVFDGDEAALELAFAYHFPNASGRNSRTGAPIWNAESIDAWRQKLKADMKALSRVALAK